MHEHNDKSCKHELKECAECGNVYCAKCEREWYKTSGWRYTFAPQISYDATGTVPWTTVSYSPHTHQ